jgi:galactosyltransferase
MGKTLIAVAGCHKNQARADAQRQTWVKDVGTAADVRFFSGKPHPDGPIPDDELWLNCPDGYKDRKEKVIAIIQWAVEHGYDYLWKVDDDVYLRPERLLALEPHDYYGAIVPYTKHRCFGAIYGLSRSSMETLIMRDTLADQLREDVWVADRLRELGVSPANLGWVDGVGGRFRMTHIKGEPFGVNLHPPRPDNDVIASWEHITLSQMLTIHAGFHPEIETTAPEMVTGPLGP